MTAIVCGSFAYDHIMAYPGRFKDHLLPENIHILNVCFVAPDMRREFGGCAGNIAYNLSLLGEDCLPVGTVGHDFTDYRQWLESHGIDLRCLRVLEDAHTAQCFITTDLDNNQITMFQLGAMARAHENPVPPVAGAAVGIVAPDGREGMLQHARQLEAANIPFIFDPGQNVTVLSGEELMQGIEQAAWLAFNDYEWQLVAEKTALTESAALELAEALIITRGAQGSVIHARGETHEIPAVPALRPVDPTGCGDAYRAGLLAGLMRGCDWPTTGRIASLMGKIKIESRGTQNHRFSGQEFAGLFEQSFGYSP